MPSYMLQEVRQQRSEQGRQHGQLLTAITALVQLRAQPQQPVSVQAQPQAGAQGEAQTPPPAENLQSRAGPGAMGGPAIWRCQKCRKSDSWQMNYMT